MDECCFSRRLLTMLACLGMLAGCGGPDDASRSPSSAPKPAAPSRLALAAVPRSPTDMDLSWSGADIPGAVFRIYRDGYLVQKTQARSDHVLNRGLAPGSEHCYEVMATDPAGEPIADSDKECAATPTLAGWNMETIATAPPVSMALDPQGLERMAFCSQWNGVIYMAHQADGTWSSTAVDSMARCFNALIGVGGDGSDYLVYMDDDSDQLKYATDASGSWIVTTVPGADGAEFYAMAVDAADHVHLAFQRFTGVAPDCFDIVYETDASGSWESQTVAKGDVYPAIAVDGAGAAYITFLGRQGVDGSYPVHYLSDASGVWTDSEVAESTDPKSLVAIAVDGAGHGHLVYKSRLAVHYVTDAAGSWLGSQVDAFDPGPEDDSYGAYDVSIALDSFRRPHVSYQDTSGDLKYASVSGGAWQGVYVATDGAQNSLCLDPSGHAHVSFAYHDNLYTILAVSP